MSNEEKPKFVNTTNGTVVIYGEDGRMLHVAPFDRRGKDDGATYVCEGEFYRQFVSTKGPLYPFPDQPEPVAVVSQPVEPVQSAPVTDADGDGDASGISDSEGDADSTEEEEAEEETGDEVGGEDEAGDDEAGDDEVGDDEAGDDEAGDDEAGDDEAGDDEAGDDEAGEGFNSVDGTVNDDEGAASDKTQRVDYTSFLKDELRERCEKRNIMFAARDNKDDLIAKLVNADNAAKRKGKLQDHLSRG